MYFTGYAELVKEGQLRASNLETVKSWGINTKAADVKRQSSSSGSWSKAVLIWFE
jgi:hypothetical protein